MQTFQAQWKTWGIIRWRSLSWAEFKKFEQRVTYSCPMEVANDIYRAVVILGPDPDDLSAGVIEYIVKHVFTNNAFSGDSKILEIKLNRQRNNLASDYLIAARAVVASAFKYTFEEIDLWDEEVFLERLAQAEFIAGKDLPIRYPEPPEDLIKKTQPNKPVNPDRKKKQLTAAQQLVMDRVMKNGN